MGNILSQSSKIYKSTKLYFVSIILLGVFAFNTYQIENHFIFSFICLILGCLYSGIYFFSTIEENVKGKKFFNIFIKGLIFYLALFKLFANFIITFQ